eukprot:1128574-Alexandrium_andersonii.AAC.1
MGLGVRCRTAAAAAVWPGAGPRAGGPDRPAGKGRPRGQEGRWQVRLPEGWQGARQREGQAQAEGPMP